jgi:hypothetical protein
MPGVRFVPVEHGEPAFDSAVLTLPDSNEELATARFVRAVAHASRVTAVPAPPPVSVIALAA